MSHIEEPELDLGFEPLTPPQRPPQPVMHRISEKRSWARYTAMNRKFCDLCFEATPKTKGVPVRAIERATWTEDGPAGRLWLCTPHKSERETEDSLADAAKRRAAQASRQSKKKR